MSETRSQDTCRRCGHATQQHVHGVSHLARRALRLKPARVRCGEQTEHGWQCPCRSRFHAA